MPTAIGNKFPPTKTSYPARSCGSELVRDEQCRLSRQSAVNKKPPAGAGGFGHDKRCRYIAVPLCDGEVTVFQLQLV